MKKVNIVGAGLSGLSAAIALAEKGVPCRLISTMPSERAQSVLAEGGINAALDTMGEGDSVEEHFRDTMRGGCMLEDESAVRNLTGRAPDVVRRLFALGAPLMHDGDRLILRNFGGQKKKRTAFAKASTGKIIMTALIDEVRKYEASGLVERMSCHELVGIDVKDGELQRIVVRDRIGGKTLAISGVTILCTGGMNGFFEGMTTGTTQNTGNAAALCFAAGAAMSDLEFIQYHPTTVSISGKRMLISEAARGEGGRLYIMKNGSPLYFMEEKYPELGNLMPRDVVSREMYFVTHSGEYEGGVYLDMRGISDDVWDGKLSDLRAEILEYMHIDVRDTPIEVSPGIHFFMGGFEVDDDHRTNIGGLYAAGECACKYHGANRLGGNSLLGAIVGGEIAGNSAASALSESLCEVLPENEAALYDSKSDPAIRARLRDILLDGMGIVRDKETLEKMLGELDELSRRGDLSRTDSARVLLAIAMGRAALGRKESRGAHYRSDYPECGEKGIRSRSVV